MRRESDAVCAVRRMQEYIEAHLAEPISLRQLADVAGYSPWHSARLFKELLQKPPFDYVRARRLSQAALQLRDGVPNHVKLRIVDVAFDFVFDSHEGFTRAFSKQFGISPAAYRTHTPPIQLFMPYPVSDAGIMKRERQAAAMETKTKTLFVQVVERPARKLMLKRGVQAQDYFAYCEEVGCDVWGVLCSVKEALYEPVGMWLPAHLIQPGTSKYVQGVELPLDFDNTVPDGFDLIELPPCQVMVFQGEPYDDEYFTDAIGAAWDAIEQYNPELYGFAWAQEDAPRFQLEPRGYRGYIEARPVRPLNAAR